MYGVIQQYRYAIFTQGLNSLSGKTSYRQISRRLEAARLEVKMIVSLWIFTGICAKLLLRRPVKLQNDCKSLNPNLVTSILHVILPKDVRPLSE